MTICTERKLLEVGLTDKFQGHASVRCPERKYGPLYRDKDPCWTCRVRAFLADPPACDAEKAVLVAALEKAKSLVWESLSHIEHGQQKSLAHLHALLTKADKAISPVLADPSPAAAALLAQAKGCCKDGGE
jgi:hypothetical protein